MEEMRQTTENIERNKSGSSTKFIQILLGCVVSAVLGFGLAAGVLYGGLNLLGNSNSAQKAGEILPLGTVVQLKDGAVKLMIVGRGQLYNDGGTLGYFDYSAVMYPQGIMGEDQFAFFNQEDIDKVFDEGHRDANEKKFAKEYEDKIKQSGYPKLNVNDMKSGTKS